MLKKLIHDLAHENITLSQGLTRGKIIGATIKNDTFTKWVTQELSGYDLTTTSLPDYRKLKSNLYLSFRINGAREDVPIEIPFDCPTLHDLVEYLRVYDPISSIESSLETIPTPTLAAHFDKKRSDLVFTAIEKLEPKFTAYKSHFSFVLQVCTKTQYREIIETAKQSFLDTLLKLDEEFPDLSDRFDYNRENAQKVNNIVNNFIYGNHSPLTLAVGNEVIQQSSSLK
ncbi:MAG TPA: hypothetical protein VNS58_08975 [Puia sp.]|nr:hypothetical protein [Puia sp.]